MKYGARKVYAVEGVFDSQLEYKRWRELVLLQRAGEISGLRRQVPYRLEVNGVLIGKYTADFVFIENGQTVTEDAKGVITRDYPLRKKLMLACHGIAIREWPPREKKKRKYIGSKVDS